MPYRFLSLVFVLIGIACIALGVYMGFAPEPTPNVDLAEPDVQVADAIPGRPMLVTFEFDNRSTEPVRVLNLVGC